MAACGIWGGVSRLWKWRAGELPPFEPCCEAHDAHYVKQDMTRAGADREFRQCVEAKGHPALAWAFWVCIRIGGGFLWRSHQ